MQVENVVILAKYLFFRLTVQSNHYSSNLYGLYSRADDDDWSAFHVSFRGEAVDCYQLQRSNRVLAYLEALKDLKFVVTSIRKECCYYFSCFTTSIYNEPVLRLIKNVVPVLALYFS